ncbi:MAG: efflux RND transporter periplasmic adaptor subunit [Steroidobacteraceae bacterium]
MNDPAPVEAPNGKRRRILGTIAVVFVTLGVAWLLLEHFVLSQRERTDDAYVAGNQVSVSSQVPGTVVEVTAENTSLVEAGQVLVRLDPVDAQQALARAEASLAQAVRQVRQQQAQAGQFDAGITARQLELARAEADLTRREPLLSDQAIAPEELRHARDAVALARSALSQAQRQATAAHALVDNGDLATNPAVLQARVAYRDAWIAAQRNAIVAPVRGYVALRSVQLGQRIVPGQMLMSIIALDNLWLDANFKESQIRNLRLGQPVEVVSDLYGGDVVYHGKVLGLAAGTGAAFALLPAQNASGNWIKVVQRVPVKIALDREELLAHPLRIGLSTTATIDTHDRDGVVLAAAPATNTTSTTRVYTTDLAEADRAAQTIIDAHSRGAAAAG